MMNIYQYDDRKAFTGVTRQIEPTAGAPLGWTRTEPPATGDGEWAVFSGQSGWQIVTTEPAFPAPPIPETVTKRQFVQQLIAEDLYDAVSAILDAIPDPVERQLMWSWFRDSNEFERHRPELIQIAVQLGKSAAEIDEFFRRADAR